MPTRKTTRLSRRIDDLGLSPQVRRTFGDGLMEVARAGGGPGADALALIDKLVDRPQLSPAPFESLWPVAELFLTACVYVAVADGQYTVEEARIISLFAQRLGHSARQLATIEQRTFEELKLRGAQGLERDRLRAERASEPAPLDEVAVHPSYDEDMEPTQLAFPDERRR